MARNNLSIPPSLLVFDGISTFLQACLLPEKALVSQITFLASNCLPRYCSGSFFLKPFSICKLAKRGREAPCLFRSAPFAQLAITSVIALMAYGHFSSWIVKGIILGIQGRVAMLVTAPRPDNDASLQNTFYAALGGQGTFEYTGLREQNRAEILGGVSLTVTSVALTILGVHPVIMTVASYLTFAAVSAVSRFALERMSTT